MGDIVHIGDAHYLTEMIPDFKKGTGFHSAWETPEAFIRHIKSLDPKNCWGDPSAWDKGREEFSGSKSMEEAIEMAENGWDEGVQKIETIRQGILVANPVLPKVIKYGIAGAYPNVPRAIAGNIMNMRTIDLAKSRRRPVITLVSNMCDNWTTDKEMVTNRAAVVAALIDKIEQEGYACEVITTAVTRGHREEPFTAAVSVLVKKSTQMVDTRRLAFALGHASFFRRMVFADWEIAPNCERGLGSGLGRAHGISSVGDLNLQQIYIIPSVNGLDGNFGDEEKSCKSGLNSIIKSLKSQGCPAFKDTPTFLSEKEKIELRKAA